MTLTLATTSTAFADGRHRAVPRARVHRPPVVVAPRPLYSRAYRPRVNLAFFYGYPGYFGSYAWGRPVYGYSAYGPYSYPVPYGHGYYGYGGRPYGGVRIDLPQRDAEVLVDGYYVGRVDDFDGVLQGLKLEPGNYAVEVVLPGFAPLQFDVQITPGRTTTYRGSLYPEP